MVLFFYPRGDTSGCTREAKDFSDLKAKFHCAGASFIGISADSTASHDKFNGKHSLTVDLVSDEPTDMLNSYGVWIDKQMYGRSY